MNTVTAENRGKAWEDRRFQENMPEPAPTYVHRVVGILSILRWCWAAQPQRPAAVLDVSAGVGAIGSYGRRSVQQGKLPPFAYHATEQTVPICRQIKEALPTASVAAWRLDADGDAGTDGEPEAAGAVASLERALSNAEDTFMTEYPVVLLSHVLEHVEDYYGLIDAAWHFVAPGGFLVLCVPRHEEHRTHHTLWEWNRLLALLSQYADGGAVACWDYTRMGLPDMFAAVGKTPAAAADEAPQILVQADDRLNGSHPIHLDRSAQTRLRGVN